MKAAAGAVVIPSGEDFRIDEIILPHFALEKFATDKCEPCLAEADHSSFQTDRMKPGLSDLVTVLSRFGSANLQGLAALLPEEAEGHLCIVLDKTVCIALWPDENHCNRPIPQPAEATPGGRHSIEIVYIAGAHQHPFLPYKFENILFGEDSDIFFLHIIKIEKTIHITNNQIWISVLIGSFALFQNESLHHSLYLLFYKCCQV